MRSATAGACGSSRRLPRPRLLPACSFFVGIIEPGLWNMRSATAGVYGSSRRIPRPRLPPACSFLCRGEEGTGLRRRGRGAPWPANPYFFVGRHHVPGSVRTFGALDVVLQGSQTLILSSGGTTSLSPSVPSAPRTWCFKARKSLYFRREAPRPWVRPGLRRPIYSIYLYIFLCENVESICRYHL